MRNCKADFEDTCKLMRKYIEQNRPQSFASVWGVFEKQKKRCELNKISIDDVSDMDYMKFIEVIQDKLTMEIENHKTSYGTTGKMYDILKKAEKDLIEW